GAGSGETLGHQGDLEGPRHPVHRDGRRSEAELFERALRAVDERSGDVRVEAPGNDGQAHPARVERTFELLVVTQLPAPSDLTEMLEIEQVAHLLLLGAEVR